MTLTQTLQTLIQFKTVAGDFDHNRQALNWIKVCLKDLPLYIEDIQSNGYDSLLITTQKTKQPKLWLAAHIDVVPGSEQTFQPQVREGKLYGRGALDMKFAIACYIQLFLEIGDNLKDYDIGMMITTDEELGGFNGVNVLVDRGYTSDIVFLPDGGFNWEIEEKAKGIWHLEAISEGKTAHASRPWEGNSSLKHLIHFLSEINTIFPHEPCGDITHYHSTFNIGTLQGGEATNQIAALAIATIDIRFIPEDGKQKIFDEIQNIKNKYLNITLKETKFGPSYKHDLAHKDFELFRQIAHQTHEVKVGNSFSHGSSDARFFALQGIPVLSVCPLGGGHHGEQEWIDLHSLHQYYDILKSWVTQIGK